MYELILHSQIAPTRYSQVLHILAGVAAMQPVDFLEHTLIFQQLKSAESAATSRKGGASQAAAVQRLRYHKVVRDVSDPDHPGSWKLKIEETPDAGIKDVNARSISERIVSEEQTKRFQTGSEWYKFTTQYITKGSLFVHGNVIVRLFRLFALKTPPNDDPMNAPPPTTTNLEILDKSGTWFIETYIRTEDTPSPALRDKATEELMKFAKSLEGAVDLRAVNRLALDTSIKGT